MLSFLQPKDGPVVAGEEASEVVYAKDQPEYIPLRTQKSEWREGGVVSRWSPTEEQRKAIAEGKDIFLELLTFHQPLQPILMYIGDDSDGPAILCRLGKVPEA